MATKTRARVPGASEIVYPESDGQPMGETGVHVAVSFGLMSMLQHFYRGNSRVAILANMFVYYVEGNPSKCVCPDLFVTLGVDANPYRRIFKVWAEGKAPDLVVEVTSRETNEQDRVGKFQIYRDILKVREYILFDPLEEYLEPSLQGYRLDRRRYVPIARVAGRLPSEVLGLHLERDELNLRLYDPRTRRWVPTQEELEKELQQSKVARRREAEARHREAEARRQAEAEVARLRQEIEELRRKQATDS
jgi:Uma2 family endonuclease